MPDPIKRPNGKLYRPRALITYAIGDEDEILCGVMVLGTHDLTVAQPLADQYAQWQLGETYRATDPDRGWYREGFEAGQLRWISDEVRGRGGVCFHKIVEVEPCPACGGYDGGASSGPGAGCICEDIKTLATLPAIPEDDDAS